MHWLYPYILPMMTGWFITFNCFGCSTLSSHKSYHRVVMMDGASLATNIILASTFYFELSMCLSMAMHLCNSLVSTANMHQSAWKCAWSVHACTSITCAAFGGLPCTQAPLRCVHEPPGTRGLLPGAPEEGISRCRKCSAKNWAFRGDSGILNSG